MPGLRGIHRGRVGGDRVENHGHLLIQPLFFFHGEELAVQQNGRVPFLLGHVQEFESEHSGIADPGRMVRTDQLAPAFDVAAGHEVAERDHPPSDPVARFQDLDVAPFLQQLPGAGQAREAGPEDQNPRTVAAARFRERPPGRATCRAQGESRRGGHEGLQDLAPGDQGILRSVSLLKPGIEGTGHGVLLMVQCSRGAREERRIQSGRSARTTSLQFKPATWLARPAVDLPRRTFRTGDHRDSFASGQALRPDCLAAVASGRAWLKASGRAWLKASGRFDF